MEGREYSAEELLGPGTGRAVKENLGRRVLRDNSLVQEEDAIGHGTGEAHLVRHHDEA